MKRRSSWSERLLARIVGSAEATEGLVGDLREEARRRGTRPGSVRYHLAVLGVALRYLTERGTSAVGRDARRRDADRHAAWSLEAVLADLRVSARSLARAPTFTLVMLVTLALGVGATTAIFSVVNGVLLRPLPYPDSRELMRVHASWEGNPVADLSPGEHFDFRDRLRAFEAFGTYAYGSVTVAGDDGPRRVAAAFVSAGVLEALAVDPVVGRRLLPDETGPDSDRILVGHGFWQAELGGDRGVLESGLVVDGTTVAIVGVLPPDFRLPEAAVSGRPVDIVAPLGLDRTSVTSHGSHFLLGIGRRRPDVTAAEARADVAGVGRWIHDTYAQDYGGPMAFGAEPLAETLVGDSRPALLVLLAAAAFVLLIALANTANLMLTRADGRRRAHAIRAALGAGRSRVVGLILAESLLLGLVGGALGVALAWGGVEALVALDPPDVPRLADVSVDGAVLAFALALSVVTGLLCGLLPALRVTRRGGEGSSLDGRAGLGGDRAGRRFRRLLVIGEVAFAVVLLTGAVLFTRSFAELLGVDPGVRVENVLTTRVSADGSRYAGDAEVRTLYASLESRLQALPGVVAAGAVVNLPLDQGLGDMGIEPEGQPIPPGGDKPAADWQVVTPGYFEALDVRPVAGRVLDERDRSGAPGAAVINETMAERFWPGQDPLGRRFRLGGGAAPEWVSVVGVVRDIAHGGLDVEAKPQFFVSHGQFRFWDGGGAARSMALVARAAGPAAQLAPAVRRAVAEVDPGLALAEFRTMEEIRSASVSRPRFLVALLGAFGVLALVLASVGTYGVVSYGVRQRAGEIGVRVALGAGAASVVGMVLGDTLRLVGAGLAIGVVAALLLGRTVSGLLFGVSPGDPVSLLTVSAVLAGVAALATWIPARWATRIDPSEALRAE